jgi:hypothetical protein
MNPSIQGIQYHNGPLDIHQIDSDKILGGRRYKMNMPHISILSTIFILTFKDLTTTPDE